MNFHLRCALPGAALACLLLAATTSQAADVDVGVSIGIGQPGVDGRIDIGRFPQPQLIVQRPVVDDQPARRLQPIYLHVPPGHRQNWRTHCRADGACGTPVYFVQERWYQDHGVRGEPRHGERDSRRGKRMEDHREDHRDGHRVNRRGGPGQGRGHGHGHG